MTSAPRRSRRCPARRSRACWACSPAPTRRTSSPSSSRGVVWDRVTDVVEGRRDARVVAVTSGGTIPDRGLFGVFLAGEAGTPGPARRRARRGDGLRAPRRDARRRDRPRRERWRVAGHQPRPGDRRARRRACRASCRSGRATRSAGRSSWAGRSARSSREVEGDLARGARRAARVATARLREHARPRRAGGREPARLPRGGARGRRARCRPTGGSSSSASATSWATGGCAS